MAAKQMIFGLEDKPVIEAAQADVTQPTKPDEKADLGTGKEKEKEKDKLKQPTKRTNKKRSAASNLGVQVDMKQLVNTPVPHVLPSTLPNQPVITQGMIISGNPVIAPVPAEPAPLTQNPNQYDPAVKHPAVMQDLPASKKAKSYKPEITHPAVLKETKSTKLKSTKLKSTKLKSIKPKFLDFKQRLALKQKAAQNAQQKAENASNATKAGNKKKTIKQKSAGKKSSKRAIDKNPKANVMF
jgi:hypothetical protein